MQHIKEGKAELFSEVAVIPSKKMTVFYNPIMKVNRDLTILLLNTLPMRNMRIADPLAGTGIRAIRLCRELKLGKIERISINDYSEDAMKSIKYNLKQNNLKNFEIDKQTETCHIHLFQKDANIFLLESKGFQYIDIDPFGSPNPFLESAVQRISREGILAVTATDVSALAGTYPKVCLRKYWALPKRNELKHEFGARILIRKVQLIGAQYEKALIPLYSYSHEHYLRIFFQVEKSKSACDKIIKQHKMHQDAGPLWTGALWDAKLADDMQKEAEQCDYVCDETKKLVSVIAEEAKIPVFGFFEVHKTAKQEKVKQIPPFHDLIKEIQKQKHKVARTHFSLKGLRTTMPEEEFRKLLADYRKKK